MPVYDFQCLKCKEQFEAYVPKIGDSLACTCGAETERIWSITKRSAISVFPYITKNIHPDGKPIEVQSESHLKRLCSQYKVTHRPDIAWTEKEYLGYDWRTKTQRYKEGSGAGLPGVWV